MTLVEFLHPIRTGTNRDRCLAVLYYKQRHENIDSMTASQIKDALEGCRLPNLKSINVADVMAKCGALIDSLSTAGATSARLWRLTGLGKEHVRKLLRLPETEVEVQHEVDELKKLLGRLADPVIKGFVEEAVTCLSVGALKASIVFLWAGAVATLRDEVAKKGFPAVNAAIQVHDKTARTVKKADDFQYINDAVFLLVAEGVGVLDKAQRQTLGDTLNLRNKCGHPTKYSPGPAKTKSFIEDVTNIVFP